MVLFKKRLKTGEHEIVREGAEDVMHINYEEYPQIPSLEDDALTMSRVIEKLAVTPVARIVFYQKKKYEYSYHQTQILVEVAQIYNYFVKQKKLLTLAALEMFGPVQDVSLRLKNLQYLILNLLRTDPVGAFVEVRRFLREERIESERVRSEEYQIVLKPYLNVLEELYNLLEKSKLIAQAQPYLQGYVVGSRDIYRLLFRPIITPDFMMTRLAATPPLDAEELDAYQLGKNAYVQIFSVKDTIKQLYHLIPPEFQISEDKYELVDLARKVLAEHQPKAEEFIEPEKMRETFFNIGRDLLTELADHRGLDLSFEEIEEMARILVRYTVGFGMIETLLQDPNVQDISINSPPGANPVFVVHGKYDECVTNIVPSVEDVESWATKFRLISARPLDEANPVLDTELIIPGARARVAVISKPLNPSGLAFSIRRHRDQPWTLPLFMKNGMLTDLAAGLISFVIDGNRTLLVAGTRGSGKCVAGDTLIQLSNGLIKKIKDINRNQNFEIADGSLAMLGESVIGLKGYQTINSNALAHWKRDAPTMLIKIRTGSGREIITTEEHIYFSYRSHHILEKNAKMLEFNDFIAIPRRTTVVGDVQTVVLTANVQTECEYFYVIKGRTNARPFRFQKVVDEDLAELLGYIIGDGHLSRGGVYFFNTNPSLRDHYKHLISRFGLNFSEKEERTTWGVGITSRALVKIFNEVFGIPIGKKANKVYIPEQVLCSKDSVLAAFLRGYFDCDSYVSKSARDLELSTASELMARQLEMALLRFGIVAFRKNKTVKGTNYFLIRIRGEFVEKYAECISYNHPIKHERLKRIIQKNIKSNTNVDSIPFGNSLVETLRSKLRIRPKDQRDEVKIDHWNYKAENNNISRNTFKKLVKYYSERYSLLRSLQRDANLLKEYVEFSDRDIACVFKELKKILNFKYSEVACVIGCSEAVVRKNLNGNAALLKTNWGKISLFIEQRLVECESYLENNGLLVSSNVLSYVEMSEALGIPETSLKSYFYGGIEPPPERASAIQSFLIKKKEKLKEEFNNCKEDLLSLKLCVPVAISNAKKIIHRFKKVLHIQNIDFGLNLSLGTVSNFSKEKYKMQRGATYVEISRALIKIYEETVSPYTTLLLEEAQNLAESDIFWDRVIGVEEVFDHGEEFVYDFTVEDTHNFIANGMLAHNTSLLGSVLVEIMRKYRIISIEDTLELPTEALRSLGYNIQSMKVRSALAVGGSEVTADEGIRTSLRMGDSSLIVGEVRSSIRGNEEVLIVEKSMLKRVQIRDLEGKDISQIYVPSMDVDLKFKLKKLLAFVKHPQRKKLLKVTTRTGRKITVTPDHSLFTHKDFKIIPIECGELKVGNKIVIPEKLPVLNESSNSINLLELLEEEGCRLVNYENDLNQIIKKIGYKKASVLCNASNDIYQYLRKGVQHTNLSIKHYKILAKEASHSISTTGLQIKTGTSKTLNAEIEVCKDFCRFLGYYTSEGWTERDGSVVLSNEDGVIIRDIIDLSKKLFNITPYVRETESLGISTQIKLSNKVLGLMLKNLGCGRVALEKRIPAIIFSLSEEKICEYLKGYFDGDGSQTSVLQSGNRVACSTISEGLAKDLLYLFLQLGIVARCYEKEKKGIGKHRSYVIEFKQRKYVELFLEKVGFKKYKKTLINRAFSHSKQNVVNYDVAVLEKNVELKRKFRHLRGYNSCGKEYLRKVVAKAGYASDIIKNFVEGEFFLDEVKSIEEISLSKGEYVYDLSVEPCQNFIGGFGGIMLHNTEAKALYEAMRVGALANVVAGTIHGDSPYGVFDRVVNDLQVPCTSFKATDLIVVANPIRSADGLHRSRRITQITEVRKEWEHDPLVEKGFVDLMKYDSHSDALVPTDELIHGDSVILKAIGGQIREWAGSWDAIWENVLLRAKVKKAMVEYSLRLGLPDLIEAADVVMMNDEFHKVSERVREELGYLESKRIFFEWEESLKRYIKRKYQR